MQMNFLSGTWNPTAGTDYALLLFNLDTSAETDLSCPCEPPEGLPGHDKSVPAEGWMPTLNS